jgi:hypothetical protein
MVSVESEPVELDDYVLNSLDSKIRLERHPRFNKNQQPQLLRLLGKAEAPNFYLAIKTALLTPLSPLQFPNKQLPPPHTPSNHRQTLKLPNKKVRKGNKKRNFLNRKSFSETSVRKA